MRVVTFGEVMLRLAPEGLLRLRQSLPGRLEATFGGGFVVVEAGERRFGSGVRAWGGLGGETRHEG